MKTDVIKIITSVIKSNKMKLDIDYPSVFRVLQFHNLDVFLYYAYKMGVIDIDQEQADELKKIYAKNIYKTSVQEDELKIIKTTFKEYNLMFLPLKGSVIRNIYPSIDLRTMADIDILVKPDDLKTVYKLMINLGYKSITRGGNHDVYYKTPFMNVEIHHAMMDESYEMSKYYQDIWDKVLNDREYPYLSDEDVYIFIVAHAAKHYLSGGTGLRSVIDVYLFNQKYDLDYDYIDIEFNKLNIKKFAENIKSLGEAWFNDTKLSPELVRMENYILKSGVYGIHSHQIANDFNNSNDSKLIIALKKAFPSFKIMKKMFPSLKYLFILLPLYYIYRIIKGLFKGNVQRQIKVLSKIDDKKLKTKQDVLKDMQDD